MATKNTFIWGTDTIHKTRFTELGYSNIAPGCWQCVDLTGDRPAQVGTQYATKAELLANLEAYATEYGCENANPKSPVPAYLKPYDGQAHHMAKAAHSLVLMLSGLDYSKFTLDDATRLTATFHGLIKTVEFAAKYPNLARHTVPEREDSEPTIYGGRVDHSQVETVEGEKI